MYTKYQSLINSDHVREQYQQTSRSSNELYRYHHEPISSTLLRRDIPPIFILAFFLFLIIIILSQILVVHSSRYETNFSAMQKIQGELKEMDESMEKILRNNVLPVDKWRLLFHLQTYLNRFEYLFDLFNNETNSTNENFNQTIIQFHMEKFINKSNKILKQENKNSYLRDNIKHVQNRLEEMVDQNNASYQWKQEKRKYKHKRRKYCNEQPSQLSMFEKKEKYSFLVSFLFCRRSNS